MSCCALGDAGVAALASALTEGADCGGDGKDGNLRCGRLARLLLANDGVGDVGAEALRNALRSNTTLTLLDLSENAIGGRMCAALREAARKIARYFKIFAPDLA